MKKNNYIVELILKDDTEVLVKHDVVLNTIADIKMFHGISLLEHIMIEMLKQANLLNEYREMEEDAKSLGNQLYEEAKKKQQ